MTTCDVLTIGAATRDVFLQSPVFEEIPDGLAPDRFSVCLALGSKIPLSALTTTSGGGATNAAVTFQRFGLKTMALARVGRDMAGQQIVMELKRDGIDTHAIQQDQRRQTTHSVILLAGAGHRAILSYRDASDHIAFETLSSLKPRWVYLTSLGGNLPANRKVFRHLKQKKLPVAWNPGVGELEHGWKPLLPCLKQTTVLSLNREEASLLTGKPMRQLSQILMQLNTLPCQIVMVSDGGDGAYLMHDQQVFYAPALRAKRINTTGAGDALGSGCVAALIQGARVDDALRTGVLNATQVIQRMGAKAGILSYRPTKSQLAQVKIKQMSIDQV